MSARVAADSAPRYERRGGRAGGRAERSAAGPARSGPS